MENASNWLDENKFLERYSGTSKAIVGALLGNESVRKIAKILKVNSDWCTTGENIYTFQVNRKIVQAARRYREEFEGDSKAAKTVRRINTKKDLKKFIKKWVHDNTTPSSNTRNVIHSAEGGITFDHVIHW